ncbi:MAG: hypothetical protein ACI865_000996 [Flavobacteriaceae bacterium]|jgi:hypothetical protein
MKLLKLVVDSPDIVPFANQVKKSFRLDYMNQSADMLLMASEVYKFRNSATQMNMVVMKFVDGKIHVDIIGAAGTAGFLGVLGISLWSESGFVKSMKRTMENICALNNIDVKERYDREV